MPETSFTKVISKILFFLIVLSGFILIRYNPETDKLEPSVVQFGDKDLGTISRIIFKVFTVLRFIKVKEIEDKENKGVKYEATNFTIINFALNIMGPTHEQTLTIRLLILQVYILTVYKYFYKNIIFSFFKGFLLLCRVYGSLSSLKIILLLNIKI